jgi:pimeloyl-ACP methyl ester carboxylesterase
VPSASRVCYPSPVAEADNPISVEGVHFSRQRLTVEEGIRLELYRWRPERETGAEPIFFVAGWISLVSGWKPLLERLVTTHPIYYLETREKRSAEIDPLLMRPESFSIPRLADDLIAASEQLGLDGGRTVLFGSSMGSNAILEALKGGRLPAKAAFLVGPNAEFVFPWWGPTAIKILPPAVIQGLKRFVIWYMRRFRVNARDDPAQMARYVRTIREADPERLKLSALAVVGYSVMPGLETISTPVAVACAASDSLHSEDEVRRIVDAMPRGTAVACPSNTYMHTAAVAGDMESYLAGLAVTTETT